MSPIRNQSEPGGDGKKPRNRETAAATFLMASLAGLWLVATSCSSSRNDGTDADSLTQGSDASPQSVSDDQKGIAEAWIEEDRAVHEHLDSPGWIDRTAGIAHVPIGRAMDLILLEKDPSGPQSEESEAKGPQGKDTALRSAGRELFRKYGCDVCHSPSAYVHAPSLVGIYGERVRLTDGTFVQADDQFLRNSILHAGAQVVAGYPPIMPSFSGYIPEPEVLELIAYLKSFRGTGGDPAATP